MNKKAFTMIELLVVIAIISLLASLGVIFYNSARAQARDSKRLSDIMIIQNALEMHKRQEGVYPLNLNFGQALIGPSETTYLAQIPNAVLPADGLCDENTNNFYYYPSNDLSSYTLVWCSGKKIAELAAGQKCTSPSGTITCQINTCQDESFNCGGSCTYEGKIYRTVSIGDQCWFKDNVNIGEKINTCNDEACSGSTCAQTCATRGSSVLNQSNADNNTYQKYCYNDDETNCYLYGGLYQWHTIMGLAQICDTEDYNCPTDQECSITSRPECSFWPEQNHQGICPEGWHVPSYDEYQDMTTYLGETEDAGQYIKTVGTAYWKNPNIANNSSDWSAIGTGVRVLDGQYRFLKEQAYFWKEKPSLGTVYVLGLYNSSAMANHAYYPRNGSALSLRCIKDTPVLPPPVTCDELESCGDNCTYEGQSYGTVLVGDQCWFKENLNVGTRISGCQGGDCVGSDCAKECSTRSDVINHQADAQTRSFQKYCYNDNDANCLLYGGLYQIHTMMALPQTCSTVVGNYHCSTQPCTLTGYPECTFYLDQETQGACPENWHIPSYDDQLALVNYLGGGTTAGGHLKEEGTNFWLDPNDADNSSAWSGRGSGWVYHGQYARLKTEGHYANERPDLSHCSLRFLNSKTSASIVYITDRTISRAIRCLKN